MAAMGARIIPTSAKMSVPAFPFRSREPPPNSMFQPNIRAMNEIAPARVAATDMTRMFCFRHELRSIRPQHDAGRGEVGDRVHRAREEEERHDSAERVPEPHCPDRPAEDDEDAREQHEEGEGTQVRSHGLPTPLSGIS